MSLSSPQRSSWQFPDISIFESALQPAGNWPLYYISSVTTSSMILYFGSVVCWVLVMACLALSSWWYHYPAFCLYSWSFCGVLIFFDIVDTSRLEVLRSFFLLVYQTSVLFVSCLVLSCLVLSCLILCSVLSCLVSLVFNILHLYLGLWLW